jgi:carotenoid cleavage dioxygenase-like enzyme
LIQSFEAEGQLIVDLLETSEPLYPQYIPLPKLFPSVKSCSVTRLAVDLASGKLESVNAVPQSVHMDFPAVLDDRRDAFWAVAMPTEPVGESKYYERLVRFEWGQGGFAEVFSTPAGSFLSGEPSMIPATTPEGTDYLICPLWRSAENRSSYLIFKALDLSAGPVVELPVEAVTHLGFHSTFVPGPPD